MEEGGAGVPSRGRRWPCSVWRIAFFSTASESKVRQWKGWFRQRRGVALAWFRAARWAVGRVVFFRFQCIRCRKQLGRGMVAAVAVGEGGVWNAYTSHLWHEQGRP